MTDKRDYLDCGDDYLNCGDDYLNCNDDVVPQPPRKDNILAEIFYAVIVLVNRVISWLSGLFKSN
jgi:hypothetical protein